MRRFSPADIEKLGLMADCGHSGTSIAHALGRTAQAVRVKACELGIRLRPPSIESRRIKLPAATWLSLKAAAVERGLTPARLAKLLIDVILKDALIDAVIDDARPARRRTNGHSGAASFHRSSQV